MKKTKLLFIALFLLSTQLVMAQPEKGKVLVGGSAGFYLNTVEDDNEFTLNLSPNMAVFINDNVAVGGGIGLTFQSVGDFKATGISVLPMARYYFPSSNEKLAFFVDGKAGLTFLSVSIDGDSDSDSAFAFSVGPGIAFILNENISIDTGLSFNRILGEIDTLNTTLNIGFQVWLP